MPGRRDPLDRLVDLAIAVPVSTAVAARRSVPVIGRMFRRTVAPGGEIVDAVAPPAAESDRPPATGDQVADAADAAVSGEAAAVADHADPAPPDVASLPIDGYDHLAARQVVDLLAALDPGELAAVDAYERAHRHRQTVLRKIEQLAT